VSECSHEELACPHCGALRPEIGEEVREELEVIPEKVIVNRYIMKKYGLRERNDYNQFRPQSSLRYKTPHEFVSSNGAQNSLWG